MNGQRPRKMTPEACSDFLDWWAEAFDQEPVDVEDPDPLLDLVLEGERRDGPTYFSRHQLESIGKWFLQHREKAQAEGEPVLHVALFASLFDTDGDGAIESAVGVSPILKAWEEAPEPQELFRQLLDDAGLLADAEDHADAATFARLMAEHEIECLALRVLDRAFILRDGEDLYRVPISGDMVRLERLTLIHPLELGQSIEERLERLNEEMEQLQSLLGDHF